MSNLGLEGTQLQKVVLGDKGISYRWKCTKCNYTGKWVLVRQVGKKNTATTIETYCPDCGQVAVRDWDM